MSQKQNPSTPEARADDPPKRFYVKPSKPVNEMTDAELHKLADELFELTVQRLGRLDRSDHG